MTATIGLAVASIRQREAFALFEEVLAQSRRPDFVSIVFQGSEADFAQLAERIREHARSQEFAQFSVVHDSRFGASRARNIALSRIPESVDWVWTPNDTTRPSEGAMADLTRLLSGVADDVGVVAMDYLVGDEYRSHVSEHPSLTGWLVWQVLEGATVWRREPLLAIGGFDERLGPASDGWTQAGEGTDVIYRLKAAGFRLIAVPVAMVGRQQHLDPRPKFKRRKEFYYAVGLGCVIRRHYLNLRGLLAIVTPLANWLLRRQRPGEVRTLDLAIAASAGRLIGIVLGDRACYLERRSEHWR